MLHFELRVNHTYIGYVAIKRLHALNETRVSAYDVEVRYKGIVKHTTVTHHYDDGAIELIAIAMRAMREMEAQSTVTPGEAVSGPV